MNITDEMVERALDATVRTHENELSLRQGLRRLGRVDTERMIRAALEAAIGDVEPLENVLGDLWMIDELFYDPDGDNDNNAYALVISRDIAGDRRAGHAWASTIDAAVRNAVANAKGEQS